MAFPSRLLNEGERVVVSTRTHPKALVAPALVLLLTLAALLLLSGLADGIESDTGSTSVGVAAGVLAAAAVLWWVVRPVVRWLTTSYTFTTRRFIKRSGFVSREGRTIPLNRISGVDFEIGVVDRMFGCGTLVVSDASTDGRVLLHDIPRVEEVQLQVAEQLHRLSGGERADDGT